MNYLTNAFTYLRNKREDRPAGLMYQYQVIGPSHPACNSLCLLVKLGYSIFSQGGIYLPGLRWIRVQYRIYIWGYNTFPRQKKYMSTMHVRKRKKKEKKYCFKTDVIYQSNQIIQRKLCNSLHTPKSLTTPKSFLLQCKVM